MGDGIISAVVMMLVTIKMAKILIEIVIHKHLRPSVVCNGCAVPMDSRTKKLT